MSTFVVLSSNVVVSSLSSSGASSPLCYKQLGRGWVRQNTTVSILFIMLLTTCFGHCGPSSGHKKIYGGKLYRVWS